MSKKKRLNPAFTHETQPEDLLRFAAMEQIMEALKKSHATAVEMSLVAGMIPVALTAIRRILAGETESVSGTLDFETIFDSPAKSMTKGAKLQ